ncbi:MAG: glycosyltransferase family 4 protein [Halarsenatibacteraceae bacterium]
MAKELVQILDQRPAMTGSGIYLQALYNRAAEAGYKQAVIAAALEDSPYQDLGGIAREDFYPVLFNSKKLPFAPFGMSDNMPYSSSQYKKMSKAQKDSFLAGYLSELEKILRRFDQPIILTHHLWLMAAGVAKSFQDLKVMAICHGTGIRQLRQNPGFAAEVKEGLNYLKQIFALNNVQKELITEHYSIGPARIKVTGLGYNSRYFSLPTEAEIIAKRSKEKPELIYAGKLSHSKGVLSLIRALEMVDNANLKVTFVGSGQGAEAQEIKARANKLKHQVEFTGQISQAEVAQRFRLADLLCLPSFYEGFALVILEALASGLRVVSSDLPGVQAKIPDHLKEAGTINFVELPELKDVDKPVESDLPGYEKRLAAAVRKQLEKVDELDFLRDPEYKKAVQSLNWESVFAEIAAEF